jgi:hypothetical protein
MARRIIVANLCGDCRHFEALRREHVTSMLADMKPKVPRDWSQSVIGLLSSIKIRFYGLRANYEHPILSYM